MPWQSWSGIVSLGNAWRVSGIESRLKEGGATLIVGWQHQQLAIDILQLGRESKDKKEHNFLQDLFIYGYPLESATSFEDRSSFFIPSSVKMST